MQRHVAGTDLGLSLGSWWHLSIPRNFLYSRQYNGITQSIPLQRTSKPLMKPLQRCELPCKGINCATNGNECFIPWSCTRFTRGRRWPGGRRTRAAARGCRAVILPASWGEGPSLLKSPSPALEPDTTSISSPAFQGSGGTWREARSLRSALQVTLKGSCYWLSGRRGPLLERCASRGPVNYQCDWRESQQ